MNFGKLKGLTAIKPKISGDPQEPGFEIRSKSRGVSSMRFFSGANAQTRIVISDMLGRTITAFSGASEKTGWQTVDVRGISNGVYIVRVTIKENGVISNKVYSIVANY
jgi:hypothetical protein